MRFRWPPVLLCSFSCISKRRYRCKQKCEDGKDQNDDEELLSTWHSILIFFVSWTIDWNSRHRINILAESDLVVIIVEHGHELLNKWKSQFDDFSAILIVCDTEQALDLSGSCIDNVVSGNGLRWDSVRDIIDWNGQRRNHSVVSGTSSRHCALANICSRYNCAISSCDLLSDHSSEAIICILVSCSECKKVWVPRAYDNVFGISRDILSTIGGTIQTNGCNSLIFVSCPIPFVWVPIFRLYIDTIVALVSSERQKRACSTLFQSWSYI